MEAAADQTFVDAPAAVTDEFGEPVAAITMIPPVPVAAVERIVAHRSPQAALAVGEEDLVLRRQRDPDGLVMLQNEATAGFVSAVTIDLAAPREANQPGFQRTNNDPSNLAAAPGIIPFAGAGAVVGHNWQYRNADAGRSYGLG